MKNKWKMEYDLDQIRIGETKLYANTKIRKKSLEVGRGCNDAKSRKKLWGTNDITGGKGGEKVSQSNICSSSVNWKEASATC